jgi:hypothetical protein
MKVMTSNLRCSTRVLLAALAGVLVYANATAGLTVIGTQYRVDQMFPEFNCYYSSGNYPTSCGIPQPGATVFVCVKNTGASSETIIDATLAGYSLDTVIKMNTSIDSLSSIYFYWDDPPDDIEFGVGEPVWWKADPPTIPAGGVAQVAVRLRKVPTDNNLNFGVVSSSGTIVTNIIVDSSVPRITGLAYSEDRKKIYLHWRRTGGAAPDSVWLNGTNVTSLTTTVGDPNYNFAASVISLPTGLPFFSFNVYQGIYSDGKTATAGQRAWTNKFVYCTWSTFEETANYNGEDWVDEASAHGFNASEMNLGNLPNDSYMQSHGYGYVILDKTKLKSFDPDFWFINDEPDAEENNQGNTHCNTGLKIPCDSSKYAGTLVMKEAVNFAAELRAVRPNVPITVNLDGGLEPQSWYTWGPAVDVLESNNYYEVRLKDSWFSYPLRLPLHVKPKVSYAVARTGSEGAAPNPFRHILYSCKGQDPDWPYPFPASKHIEAFYSLAGGTKGFGYWWLNPPRGLYNSAQAPALWKEMGLIGNEVKTARDLIVRSTPVDLPLTPGTNIWVRAMASGIDSLILYVVNDNYANDITGCHVTNVPNASVTLTLPSWMQSPTAFEISAAGLSDVGMQPSGSRLQVNLGTLKLTRMIILTTDPQLRTAIQQRYNSQVRANVCSFAPEFCVNAKPSIIDQPANQSPVAGGNASFTAYGSGTSPLGYRWQKNLANLSDGGHYSGCTTPTLTITGANQSDVAGYRCVVTNAYGSTNSSSATLTLVTYDPCITPLNSAFESGFGLAGGGYIATNWTEWETDAGGILGYDETGIIHGGAHAQRLRVSGGTNGSSGGVYQRVPVVVGQPFTASIWTYAGDSATACYLGVDPTGGTDPASGVTWSTANTSAAWMQKTVTGTATAGYITVYLKVASSDTTKRNGYFDDAIPDGCGNNPPGITEQPANEGVVVGGTASFTVSAVGSEPLSYRWQKDTVNLSDVDHYSGSTTAMLTISNANTNEAGSYRCVVTNAYGSTNSTAATLTVTNATIAPSIAQQPSNQTAAAGGTASFTVLASGNEPLSYQWQKNNADLGNAGHYAGVTTTTLTISSADNNDAASYRCVVTNAYGSTNSSPATLTVIIPNPCITILNSDFESSFNLAGGGYVATNWTEWEAEPGVVVGYDETAIVHGGAHAQRIRVSGGASGTAGGVYQRVPVTAGQPYLVSIWIYSGDSLTACSLGVDPAGGTNANSGVTWSSVTTDVAWVQKTWAGTATANYLTVYYKVASSDIVKRNGYFDDAAPGSSNTPLRLSVQLNGNTLTLTWPECAAARLEQADSLTSPVSWTTATNQISVVGGQKSVTLTPIGSAGYFRLVAE